MNATFKPTKYYKGLTRKQKIERKKEIEKFGKLSWKDPKAYVGFKTDKYGTRKTSQYTKHWHSLFPEAKSLEAKAKATGVSLNYHKGCLQSWIGSLAYRTSSWSNRTTMGLRTSSFVFVMWQNPLWPRCGPCS